VATGLGEKTMDNQLITDDLPDTVSLARRAARRKRNLLHRLAEQQDNRCFHCDAPMLLLEPHLKHDGQQMRTRANGSHVASIEHMVARAAGGANRIENLVVACRDCNSRRGKRPPTDDEVRRLAMLNEKRGIVISETRHIMEASSFGIETKASIYLMDLLTELEGEAGLKVRRRVSQILSRFNMDMAAIRCIQGEGTWDRVSRLLIEEEFKRAEIELEGDIRTTTCSVLRSILQNAKEKTAFTRRK